MLVPILELLHARRRLVSAVPRDIERRRRDLAEVLKRNARLVQFARDIHDEESKRLEGLEAKLRGQLNYLMATFPILSAILAAAWSQGHKLALALVSLALAETALAYFLTLKGTLARPVHIASVQDLEGLSEDDVDAHWGAVLLSAAEQNEPIGIELNNALAVVARSLLDSAVLAGVAGGLLLA